MGKAFGFFFRERVMKANGLRLKGAMVGLLSIVLLAAFTPLAIGDDAVLEERQRLLEAARRDGAEAVPLLTEALDDERELVNRTAAHLLAQLGEDGLPGMEKALEHPNVHLRMIAIDYLVETGKVAQYWPIILVDDAPMVRRKVQFDLLKRIDLPEGEEFEALLSELMDAYAAAPTSARRHLVDLFTSFDTLTPEARRVLVGAAGDEDDGIRLAAYEGIVKHVDRGWEQADDLLAAAKADESEAIRELGQELQWKLLEVSQVRMPQRGWRFSTDPNLAGRDAGWHAPDFDDSDWRTDVPIESSWQQHLEEDYHGAAWYRISVDVPEVANWDRAYLHFGAVDEEAWVWLNGQFIGSHEMGTAGWDVPFVLDATDALRPGQRNVLAVMAKNTSGGAGIWRPVRLRVLDTTVLD